MKILDWYIIRQFLVTAFFALIAVTIIFVVIDALEHLDDFIDRQATAGIIALYYIYFIPEIIKLIMPVALLLASLFVTARMSTQFEITAMKSNGISLYRIMVPYVIVALIISAASVYFNGWTVPLANKKKFAFERVYLQREEIAAYSTNVYFQDNPTRIISIGYYDETRNMASRVSIQDFSDTNQTVLVDRADATSMVWDSTARSWVLYQGMRRWFEGKKERAQPFTRSPAGMLHLDPGDFRKKQEKPDEMDYYTMKHFIENQQRAGQDVARWEVDFYSKVSFPFASVIVVLFGIPFSSIRRRGGVGVQLGISLLVCFIYLIFMKVSQVFGYNGDINPLLTAWLANVFFFVAAVYVMWKVPK